ncbi:hypothetical protein ACFQX7_30060 [Luedemannella flava]
MFRAMLRGLLTHKLRLVLSALAIVLGTMFMSGAFVGGDTIARGFENLFSTVDADLDVQVTAVSEVPESQLGPAPPTALVGPGAVAAIEVVPGVAQTTGQVLVDGALVVGSTGKVVPSTGPPRYGSGWVGDDSGFVVLREEGRRTRPTRSRSTPAWPRRRAWASATRRGCSPRPRPAGGVLGGGGFRVPRRSGQPRR